jgi:hypothetical protein
VLHLDANDRDALANVVVALRDAERQSANPAMALMFSGMCIDLAELAPLADFDIEAAIAGQPIRPVRRLKVPEHLADRFRAAVVADAESFARDAELSPAHKAELSEWIADVLRQVDAGRTMLAVLAERPAGDDDRALPAYLAETCASVAHHGYDEQNYRDQIEWLDMAAQLQDTA